MIKPKKKKQGFRPFYDDPAFTDQTMGKDPAFSEPYDPAFFPAKKKKRKR